MDAVAAAHSLAISSMQIFSSLLGCSKELPGSVMQQVLRALAGQDAPAAGVAAADERAVSCRGHTCCARCCATGACVLSCRGLR